MATVDIDSPLDEIFREKEQGLQLCRVDAMANYAEAQTQDYIGRRDAEPVGEKCGACERGIGCR